MKKIIVSKQNENGIEIWRYEGKEILRETHLIMLEALFNREDTIFKGFLLKNQDRFIETFFDDRWYNIFEIHDRDDDQLKGWYCDICKPAVIADDLVSYIDLSLDLWVYPDGKLEILDRDEFNQLDINELTRKKALDSLEDLSKNFFSILGSLPKVPK